MPLPDQCQTPSHESVSVPLAGTRGLVTVTIGPRPAAAAAGAAADSEAAGPASPGSGGTSSCCCHGHRKPSSCYCHGHESPRHARNMTSKKHSWPRCPTRTSPGPGLIWGGRSARNLKMVRSVFRSLCIWAFFIKITASSDCLALSDLFNSTSGNLWSNSFGWANTSDCCTWYGVSCDMLDRRVVSLDLSNNGLYGSIPQSLSKLKRLKNLTLSHNRIQGTIPEAITSLAGEYRCEGLSPDLYQYQSCDPFRDQLNKDVDCHGGTCTFVGGLSQLRLGDNILYGSLPESISRLYKTLQILDLNTNQLEGSIPRTIGALTSLVELDLYSNTLTSSIPNEMGLLTNLRYLNLAFNLLNGTIPKSLANLLRLEYLDLSVNRFRGAVPELLGVLVQPATPSCDRPGGSCFGSTIRNLTLNGLGSCDQSQLILQYVTAIKMPCNAGVQDQSYWCSSCSAPYSPSAPSPLTDCYSGLPSLPAAPNLFQQFMYPPYAPAIPNVPIPSAGPKLRISVITRCTYTPSLYAVEPS